jgi:uncharacterized protein
MTGLGLLYVRGLGVAQDYAKARELFEKAADKGDATAMANLGLIYRSGLGVAQDSSKAREWYQKAADKGNAAANASPEKLRQGARVVPKGRRQGERGPQGPP